MLSYHRIVIGHALHALARAGYTCDVWTGKEWREAPQDKPELAVAWFPPDDHVHIAAFGSQAEPFVLSCWVKGHPARTFGEIPEPLSMTLIETTRLQQAMRPHPVPDENNDPIPPPGMDMITRSFDLPPRPPGHKK